MTTDCTPRSQLQPEVLGSFNDIKNNLMLLFLSYGDFNLKGELLITHGGFLRMVRDSGIQINENKISIMMSATLQTKTNLIKQITFEQFLDLLSGLSELNDNKLYS